MIDFELPESIQQQVQMMRMVAENMFRPISREYDEREHEKPMELFNMMWEVTKAQNAAAMARARKRATDGDGSAGEKKERRPNMGSMTLVHTIATLAWGDVGLSLSVPGSGLGGAAIEAAGTPEQKERFLKRFSEGEPKWGAMAITESGAGSDTSAIKTHAVLDRATNEWVLNGEKIFCTSGWMAGEKSAGFVVVWATVDPSAGRAGIKSFVVEAGTPGFTVAKLEKKLGIRASDTATLVFQDCRIPYDNLLGTPDVGEKQTSEGYKGVLMTFDATRPAVAASAIGVARAALDCVKEMLAQEGIEIRYDKPRHQLSAVERDVLEMEAQWKAAWLLTQRAAWMNDNRIPNSLEASMAKAKAGLVVTRITQKAVELLGPLGYSKKYLIEKWFRDAKISDIYEGTQQINMLIIARRILGYSSRQLR
ncbi:MAG: acyl-CoA dehydrogenase family protein [Chloroflexi bacterium]|nr:acyl-CoA dehydrogenase family protein [Chloroflexota bacterium]